MITLRLFSLPVSLTTMRLINQQIPLRRTAKIALFVTGKRDICAVERRKSENRKAKKDQCFNFAPSEMRILKVILIFFIWLLFLTYLMALDSLISLYISQRGKRVCLLFSLSLLTSFWHQFIIYFFL